MGGLLQDLHCAQRKLSPYNGAFESPAQSWAVIQSIQNTMGGTQNRKGTAHCFRVPLPSVAFLRPALAVFLW